MVIIFMVLLPNLISLIRNAAAASGCRPTERVGL